MSSRHSSRDSLWKRVHQRGTVLDVGLIVSISVVLIVLFSLSLETKRTLAFSYTEPTLLTAFTSHYIHFSVVHLLVNVIGYSLIVSTVYLCAIAANRRTQFFVVFTVFLLFLPFVLSAFNLVFPRAGIGVGFSGVIMAFLGYLPIVLTTLLGTQLDLSMNGIHSSWLFFFGFAIIAVAAVPGLYGIGIAVVAVLSGILFLLPVIEKVHQEGIQSETVGLFEAGSAEFLMVALVTFLTYPIIAFPRDTTVIGGQINVYSHALGFCFGYLTTYVTVLAGGFESKEGV